VASHPLHGVLAQYDAEIAALQSTQNVTGLHDPGATARQGATALQADASAAAGHAQAIGGHDSAVNRAREQGAIAQVLRAEHAGSAGATTYTTELVSETNANLRNYGSALSERTERAYAARAQQLREKELTLAYDLARRNAGKRLGLRLKLDVSHPNAARRASLEAELDALNASESNAVNGMRRADAAQLAAYRAQLERETAVAAGTMDQQLRTKASANYLILQRVFNEAGNELGTLPRPSQLAAFSRSYGATSSAQAIATGMRLAGRDLSGRLQRLATADSRSQSDAGSQLRSLKANRRALYQSIVAQVETQARALARERGLQSVTFVSSPPHGGVDLTPALAARLRQEW
jgi:hypothetical protein